MCSSIIQSPGVFLVFVAIVAVSLSCILWAKSFFPGAIYGLPSQHPEGPGVNNGLPSRYYRSAAPGPAPEGPSSSNVANSPAASSSSASRPIPPPSPSPLDTRSETEPIPPRKRTNCLYTIMMFLLLLLLFSWMFYPEPVPRSIHHASHIVRALQTIEFCVKWIQIKLSVFQDGRSHLLALQSRVLEDRLLVFLPLAVPLHLAVVILLTRFGRFWRYLLLPGLTLALDGILLLVGCWDYGLFSTPWSLSPWDYRVFSPLWRRAMRKLCRRLMRRTRKYTIRQATQFLKHLQRIGGLWCSLSIAQQLFTVTPVIVWYGYVYFIPAASRATTYIKIRAAKR
ncbi:hypothetical protein C8J57DRAFT_1491588 [Mycena rebaudengoi]|nr:hypothetical protein C8J57DRAFT_1491588 [Mycena rebaudengoi]